MYYLEKFYLISFMQKNISNLKYDASDNILYFTLDEDQYKIDNVHSIKNEKIF